jgi:hypothetical protein
MVERFDVIDNPPKPPATTAQIAALEFGAIVELAKLPKAKRIKNAHSLCDSVRVAAVIAGETVSLSKPELIKRVSARLDIFGPLLMEFAEARDAARHANPTPNFVERNNCCRGTDMERPPGQPRKPRWRINGCL